MKTSFIFLFISLLFNFHISAQTTHTEYSILFYNVENLFDLRNDTLTNDDEWTPEGQRRWTYHRMEQKLLNTSKVIAGATGWEAPTLIALCEIENRFILERLRENTLLNKIPYKIIHKDSPDHRGIDVCLLYDNNKFTPIEYDYFPLVNKKGEVLRSREILYVSGELEGKDTIHLFVNHWPSRYSGVLETRESRNRAARLLKEKINHLQNEHSKAKIVVLGDFNDNPGDESIIRHLGAKTPEDVFRSEELYNLSSLWDMNKGGTLKYRSQWFTFDQIMVNGELLGAQTGLYTKPEWAVIYRPSFLLEEDKTHGGKKPFRTYSGFKYNGGFSDHFPVTLKLQFH